MSQKRCGPCKGAEEELGALTAGQTTSPTCCVAVGESLSLCFSTLNRSVGQGSLVVVVVVQYM